MQLTLNNYSGIGGTLHYATPKGSANKLNHQKNNQSSPKTPGVCGGMTFPFCMDQQEIDNS